MTFKYNDTTVNIKLPKGTGNVTKTIKKGRFYEQKFLRYISKQNIKGVYVDVGANIGNHTLFFGLFTEATKILSFEPHPKVFKILKENIKNNKLSNKVTAYNAALGEKNGKCSIEIEPSDEVGGSRVVEGADIDQWKLDKFLNENIALIKMDVEGFEKYVVKGALKILKTSKPELFIELTNKKQYEEVYGIIKNYGYMPIAVFNNSATYHFSSVKKSSLRYTFTKFYLLRRIFYNS